MFLKSFYIFLLIALNIKHFFQILPKKKKKNRKLFINTEHIVGNMFFGNTHTFLYINQYKPKLVYNSYIVFN